MAVVRPFAVAADFDHRRPVLIYAIDENLAGHIVLRKVHGVTKATERRKELAKTEVRRMQPWVAEKDGTRWAFHAANLHAAYEKAARAVKGRPAVSRVDELAVLLALDDADLERCIRFLWPEWGHASRGINARLPQFGDRLAREARGEALPAISKAERLAGAHAVRLAMELPEFGPPARIWTAYGTQTEADMNREARIIERHGGNVPDDLIKRAVELGIPAALEPFETDFMPTLIAVYRAYRGDHPPSIDAMLQVWNYGAEAYLEKAGQAALRFQQRVQEGL